MNTHIGVDCTSKIYTVSMPYSYDYIRVLKRSIGSKIDPNSRQSQFNVKLKFVGSETTELSFPPR